MNNDMKKMKFMKEVICCLLLTISSNCLFAQENQKTTTELKKKYSLVKYDNSYGGWYYVTDKINHKAGACDKKGKLVVPCKYDWVGFKGDSYQVKVEDASHNDWWGACDIKGKEIIPPIYEWCNNVKEMMEMFGNSSGGESLKERKDGENYYSITDRNKKEGLIDVLGKTIFECKYDFIQTRDLWNYGICSVRLNGKEGLYNDEGKQIVPFIYDALLLHQSDKTGKVYFNAKLNELWGLIDAKGKKLTGFDYNSIDLFSEGLSVCLKGANKDEKGNNRGGLYGYLDETGTLVVPCIYEDASSFKDGVAQVKENGVVSLLTNPLTGTKLNKLNGGGGISVKVDKDIPATGKTNEDLFAFIIVCENYTHLTGADYSINDGKVLKEYCSKTLGLSEKSIRYYEDATLGNLNNAIQKIKDIADVYDGDAKILFYFSGLGATDPVSKEAYLMPTDASISMLTTTGYSVSRLIKQLNELNTQNTIVILDAPFSGADKAGKFLSEHRGVAVKCKSPTPQNKVVVCTGSSNSENVYSNNKYGHSLLTYALLDKLQQTKGACTIKELFDYAIGWVKKESLSEYDKVQTPKITVSGDIINNWSNIKF